MHPNDAEFPSPDLRRYLRQTLLPGFGDAGQRRLASAHAVIVGVGALGCTTADLLARAGVGTLTLIDRDTVELTNLQRQTLFDEQDAREGLPKAEAAAKRLAAINSQIRVQPVVADVTARNIESLLGLSKHASSSPVSVILDGTDNFETRYLLNDVAVKHATAYCYAGVVGTRGMQATFVPGGGCMRCMFDEPPEPGTQPMCDTAGVLGPAVVVVCGAQAADAVKIMIGQQQLLSGSILSFDLWANQRQRIAIRQQPDCACCIRRNFEYLALASGGEVAGLCGQDAVQVYGPDGRGRPLDLAALAARLAPVGRVHQTSLMVRVQLEGGESLSIFNDARAIVRGTRSVERARALYARYVGA